MDSVATAPQTEQDTAQDENANPGTLMGGTHLNVNIVVETCDGGCILAVQCPQKGTRSTAIIAGRDTESDAFKRKLSRAVKKLMLEYFPSPSIVKAETATE